MKPGELVLDACCGNGVFSQRLAQFEAKVIAFDFSETFLERARARTKEHADLIEYRLLDATDEAQLLALGEGCYDAAVCNMALIDMATINPLLKSLRRLLKPKRRFVLTVQHPCFNSNAVVMATEETDRDGELRTTQSIRIEEYLNVPLDKGAGMHGEPNSTTTSTGR